MDGAGPKNADLSDANLWDADLTNAYVSKEHLCSANPALTLAGATLLTGQNFQLYWLERKDGGEEERSKP